MTGISSATGVNKALYTSMDPRQNLYELNALKASEKNEFYPDLAKIKANALATACLIPKSRWVQNMKTGSYTISTSITLSKYIESTLGCPLKAGEKFRDEPVVATGSGFLVSGSKLMTAGHCVGNHESSREVLEKNTKDMIIIFNFHMEDMSTCRDKFAKEEVYRIKRVIYHQSAPKEQEKEAPDWALLKLDRTVVGIKPLKIKREVQKGASVYMLGHPTGLPLKFSGVASIKNSAHDHKFECDLAAFAGNSGSPVIDRVTHKVVGILVYGVNDYKLDQKNQKKITSESRVVTVRIPEKDAKRSGYELCQKITLEVLDPHRIIAKEGRAKRLELSNENSEEFEKDLNEKISFLFHTKSILWSSITSPSIVNGEQIVQSVLVMRKSGEEKKSFEKIKENFGGDINLLEAKNIAKLSKTKLSKKDKILVARNMAAYNISKNFAIALREKENSFKKRFSPDKILGLLRNQTPGILEHTTPKRILKNLQELDPKYDPIYPEGEAFQEAASIACIKAIKESEKYSGYSEEDIEQISRYFVKRRHRFATFEAARERLKYPAPD